MKHKLMGINMNRLLPFMILISTTGVQLIMFYGPKWFVFVSMLYSLVVWSCYIIIYKGEKNEKDDV